jgi:two-component system sensor histidine kinase/response regulator
VIACWALIDEKKEFPRRSGQQKNQHWEKQNKKKQMAEGPIDWRARYEHEKARADELERLLEQAKDAKRSFLANISHEVRTPLNGIMTVARLLIEDSSNLTVKQKRQAHTILKCSLQLLLCVNDILDYAKLKSGALRVVNEPFTLRTVVNEATQLYGMQAAEKNIRLRAPSATQFSPELAFMGDCRRIRQVLDNLWNNALHYTPADGVISLEVHHDAPQQRVYFTLTDSGPGVQREEGECIFDVFRQSHTAAGNRSGYGSGLGLAIARGLVDQMGGKIWLDTEPTSSRPPHDPHGARFVFYVTLPLCETLETTLQHNSTTLHNRRVLIVDDMMANRLFLGQLAIKWGMLPPQMCSSGEEALFLLTSSSSHERYDIGWIDVHMNDGMGGVELAQEIRAKKITTLPLISLSSIGNEFTERTLFDASLEKPVSEPLLLHHTLALLQKHNRRSSAVLSSPDLSIPPLYSSSSLSPHSAPASLSSTGGSRISKLQTRSLPAMVTRYPLRILIADDDEVSREVLMDVLNTFPATQIEHVKVVNDGEQALHHLLSAQSETNDNDDEDWFGEKNSTNRRLGYDVAILDIVMPHMDGVECLRQLRKRGPSPAVIMLTANVSDQLRTECVALGVTGFLFKPLEISEIFGLLQRIYDR